MPDFIYSEEKGISSDLAKCLYNTRANYMFHEIEEYGGSWGSLAVFKNHYYGFETTENESQILVIIGGPVLCFSDNDFLANGNSNIGASRILDRINTVGVKWDEDLSGPFAALLIEKKKQSVSCVTDLMSFIPVYASSNRSFAISTHADALAYVTGNRSVDEVSAAEFAVAGVVTFPHTLYSGVEQTPPSTLLSFNRRTSEYFKECYWLPQECPGLGTAYSVEGYGREIRSALDGYIGSLKPILNNSAAFVTAGEDSRTVLAALDKCGASVDGFIYLDHLNREGRLAERVASSYGVALTKKIRGPFFYLDIFEDACRLISSGSQYLHAHSLGLSSELKLADYQAVFGGFGADRLLKGEHIATWRWSRKLPFLPQRKSDRPAKIEAITKSNLRSDLKDQICVRRAKHMDAVSKFRSIASIDEWFKIWPSNMALGDPNFQVNRRLFRSYEPFFSKQIVKVSASIPQKYKLNRRAFHFAIQPYLRNSKWVPHATGWFPYYGWVFNSPIRGFIWGYRAIKRKIFRVRVNEGPWADWDFIENSPQWREFYSMHGGDEVSHSRFFDQATTPHTIKVRLNLAQLDYQLSGFNVVNSESRGI